MRTNTRASASPIIALSVIAVCALGFAASPAAAEATPRTPPRTAVDCERLRAVPLEHATIAVAEVVNGNFAVPGSRDTVRNVPPLCRVVGEIHPTSDSHIGFEVWLPLDNWNGKLAGVGNGGWAGTVAYDAPPLSASLPEQARRGYAVASTNTGHGDNLGSLQTRMFAGGDAQFGYGHPERVVDFGVRAVHEMTVAAKVVTQAFYGRAPQHAYWIGCSTGGRQGLIEAQQFPEDYDGIVAGAPASYWVPLMTAGLVGTVTVLGDSARYLLDPARRLLHNAVMKACDRLDGVEDGLLEDPRRCRFDPTTLQCAAGSVAAMNCLTAAQVAVVKELYAGLRDPATGRQITPGFAPGSELLWEGFATPGRPFPIASEFYRWLVFGDSAWDWRTFDLANARDHKAWIDADRKYTPIISAVNPDLGAFRARGGKLIQYHGWADQSITPEFSLAYYESVLSHASSNGRNRAGALTDVQQFYRLFMAPGVGHCGIGGDGPNVFDMEQALETWAERGVAPDSVIATRRGRGGTPERKRPLCPYPKTAVYKGDGDINDAANFACRA